MCASIFFHRYFLFVPCLRERAHALFHRFIRRKVEISYSIYSVFGSQANFHCNFFFVIVCDPRAHFDRTIWRFFFSLSPFSGLWVHFETNRRTKKNKNSKMFCACFFLLCVCLINMCRLKQIYVVSFHIYISILIKALSIRAVDVQRNQREYNRKRICALLSSASPMWCFANKLFIFFYTRSRANVRFRSNNLVWSARRRIWVMLLITNRTAFQPNYLAVGTHIDDNANTLSLIKNRLFSSVRVSTVQSIYTSITL